ncbi:MULTISPECIES: hypothetical protein [Shewanella]|uniref:hypothetical protein n=1 Tax=Shewanella algae TaxID=38313 RepID=UPI001AAE0477|nr:hypothetical protein [Shewanella algae]MBO2566731.1 hypothetical protein [Shewanella algae]QTE90225.1 hypothetical protein JKK33_17985 [Shewanella algae]
MDNRIKYALYMNGWSFVDGDKAVLKVNALKILITEYELRMHGHIFCPECYAPLFKSPKDRDRADDGRSAYFAHSRKHQTDCGLRTKRAEGKKYLNEEEAKKAIQDEELVIVESFIKDRPEAPELKRKIFDHDKNEDIDGPMVNVPIGRHKGENFKLPSKFTTVRSITKNFDENLHRYFYFNGAKHAVQLQDIIRDIKTVEGPTDKPRFYYGEIVRSFNAGPTPQNIRMTQLKYSNQEYKDLYFKLTDEKQQEKGIDDNSKGRVLLVYGTIKESGIGLSIEKAGWGEFALLPEKYEHLLK